MKEAQPTKVKDYWEKIADQFDTIYSGRKSPFARWLDRVFRKDMYDRLRLTLEECADEKIRSVLDVGTGTGRFCIPMAGSKDRLLGIDFSESMIDLARKQAEDAGVGDRVEFQTGNFMISIRYEKRSLKPKARQAVEHGFGSIGNNGNGTFPYCNF